jgi:hypothetical protein
MKSNKQQLQNRGFIDDEDLLKYTDFTEKQVSALLYTKEAYKRTIGIRLLSGYKSEKYIPVFCELLKNETKLYTKIELCNALEKYNEKVIPYLMPLLGIIGKNQHKEIEIIDINKKSYPLPRDIVGRILIRIGPKVFPELHKLIFENRNINQITEAIEVIGHITWNYKDYSMEKTLVEYYNKNKSNEFIEWKIVRAFQSFNSIEIKEILDKIIGTHKNKVIIEEAKRSIKRIENKI